MRGFWRRTNQGVYPEEFMVEPESLMPTGEAPFELTGGLGR